MPINTSYINQLAINAEAAGEEEEETSLTPHVDSGLGRLVEQFKGKVNIEKFLKIILSELDEIEDVLTDIIVFKEIDKAYGQQLDQIGTILGRSRDGYGDADYRARLKLQIGINTSESEADIILTIWQTLTGSPIVSLTETFPAALTLTAQTSAVDATVIQEIERVSAAGVKLSYVIVSGVPFGFFDSDGFGFGTTDDAGVGGAFVSIT